jgi:hypothetical protein
MATSDGGSLGKTLIVLEDGSHLPVPDALVDDNIGRVRNPLVDDRVYTKLERNKYFQAQPSVVYFGGFVVDHMHEQVVHLINISNHTKRIHILQCETPYFRVLLKKKGKIAPGMSEKLTVQFSPNEWRYYYDTIRIHSEDDNILIPLHAYPTVAPIQAPITSSKNPSAREQPDFFPNEVDFGWCQLSKTKTKSVPIICHVPVAFEFSVRILDPHPDISVEPMEGSVPGEGHASITFSYTPSRMTTAQMLIEVSISQFGFKPKKCRVFGSAGAGSVRKDAITTITKTLRSSGIVGDDFQLENVRFVRKMMCVCVCVMWGR